MTDDDHCGECGNACAVMAVDTEYEAGHCLDGGCGPTWIGCSDAIELTTCNDVWQGVGVGAVCNEGGSEGVTGQNMFGQTCEGALDFTDPNIDVIGSCDTQHQGAIGDAFVCCCLSP